MSRTTVEINTIKKLLDSISGLDDDFIYYKLLKIEKVTDQNVREIKKYCDEDICNGTIFSKSRRNNEY